MDANVEEAVAEEVEDMTVQPVRVAVVLPSRGLIHSRTIEALDKALFYAGCEHSYFFTHDKPIPTAQNDCVSEALQGDADFILLFEEDMGIPEDGIHRMIGALASDDSGAVAANYKLRGGTMAAQFDPKGNLAYCGLGCVLVDYQVFMKLQFPWFRIDKSYSMAEEGLVACVAENHVYGGHDIHFYFSMKAAGIKFKLADFECEHFYIENFGWPYVNEGVHKIAVR